MAALSCFFDDHAAVATQLGKQVSQACRLLHGGQLGLQTGRVGNCKGRLIRVCLHLCLLITGTLVTEAAAVAAGRLAAFAVGTGVIYMLLTAAVALETPLLCGAIAVRIITGPLPPLGLSPSPLFHWLFDASSQVPATKAQHVKAVSGDFFATVEKLHQVRRGITSAGKRVVSSRLLVLPLSHVAPFALHLF